MNIDGRELTLIYDGDTDAMTVAVDHLDVSVRKGETLGIMGPSGSGKSSLLYLLSGLKRPTAGCVFYDNRDISQLGETEMNLVRRERFGFVFQRHHLISHLTVLENILLPLKSVSRQDAERAGGLMEELGIGGRGNKMPDRLSVGEKQKAAVIRSLIHRPNVLFADEPTASLDIESAMAVMGLIRRTMAEGSAVIVTHDYKILKDADRVLHMRDGKFAM